MAFAKERRRGLLRINRVMVVTFLAGLLVGAALFWSLFFLLGIKVPVPWGSPPSTKVSGENGLQASLAEYYDSAILVASAIYGRDYTALAGWLDPSEGLYIVPFSTVDFNKNLKFSQSQVKAFGEDKTTYLWGVNPDTGQPIEMVPESFFDTFLRIRDFSTAEIVGNNRVVRTGNAVENVTEAFSDAYFVDLYFSSSDPQTADWASLKLVFRPDSSGERKLIAIIHSVNTLQ